MLEAKVEASVRPAGESTGLSVGVALTPLCVGGGTPLGPVADHSVRMPVEPSSVGQPAEPEPAVGQKRQHPDGG